jgi:putative colanic acid biosynthesis UDP-glucose lipid carrier transferase
LSDAPSTRVNARWNAADLIDVSLARLALSLLWAVFCGLAILIKRSSPGPALFKQRRYGLNGEGILIYKFRSMTGF